MSNPADPFQLAPVLAHASALRGGEPLPLPDRVLLATQHVRSLAYDSSPPDAPGARDRPPLPEAQAREVERLARPRPGATREKRPVGAAAAVADEEARAKATARWQNTRNEAPAANAAYLDALAKPTRRREKFVAPAFDPERHQRRTEPVGNAAELERLAQMPKRKRGVYTGKFDGKDPHDIKNKSNKSAGGAA